jgi:hypothetical protein
VTDAAGGLAPVTALDGCNPSYAGWLSDELWFEVCGSGTPNEVKNLYAVHTLDGRVWGVPNGGTSFELLGASGATVWAVHRTFADDDTFTPEILERVTAGQPAAPVTLSGERMVRFTSHGGLFGSSDTERSNEGNGGLPGPMHAIAADHGTSRPVVPEPDGANAWVYFLSGGSGIHVLHNTDGTLEFIGEGE